MDFNLVVSTGRRLEGRCADELKYMGELVGMRIVQVSFTGFDGLLTGYVDGDPVEFIRRLKELVGSGRYIPRFVLKVVPVMMTVSTDLEAIVNAAVELASKYLGPGETYKVEVRKRGVDLGRMEIINSIASRISNKVRLENPDKVIQVEVFPTRTGVSVIREDDVFSLMKLNVKSNAQ
ncbi:MAG: THUMP domain-containing protein [Vulcanisaeta sp.]|jgi:tRNA acetyltransferase TAN1|nr:THUMP domain-containing protein [Vulcanisaeta sp.]MCG2870136.1 THUMP domain-containing protein [Vulcanisaeta sp.]MCG2880332.1 THUMP domain-containing protein [Vulcanisaeta sp.]MCG2887240.1 THUMP domain-containing protein [Vulcanisaeta sp.]MCG2892976.1 THUMP domain-containing protein [Vulcanisaeta sp.]